MLPRKPFKIYAENVEQSALDQFFAAMEMDCTVKGALMADAHTGYSLPIGGVVATEGMVFPAFVGYDIGCGVCAVRTTFHRSEVEGAAESIFNKMYEAMPVGFNGHSSPQEWSGFTNLPRSSMAREAYLIRAQYQLGTLGSGNHFVEVGYDEHDSVWVIVHSGSRNLGHQIATLYMKVASNSNKAMEGCYGLRTDTDEGRAYIMDLNFALAYALENRKRLVETAVNCMAQFLPGNAIWESLINRNHNHAEEKDGLWIHRKGATHAEEGMSGVIPGNMRDGSFIVRGRGNPDSLCSCSHGAGRVLGRKAAKRSLDIEDFKATMTNVVAKVDEHTLDEAPMAYKDIFEVMRLQSDLVDVMLHVRPILNVKG